MPNSPNPYTAPTYSSSGYTPPSDEMIQTYNLSQLRTLSIFYYVSAALSSLGILLGAAFLSFGIYTESKNSFSDPRGVTVIVFFSIVLLLLLIGVCLKFWTAYSLPRTRNRTLCLITAFFTCLNAPLGTILGIFSLVVLFRLPVQQLFANAKNP